MSSTRQPHVSQPTDPTARLGRWLFVPDQEDADGEVCVGYLSCQGERVVLSHSSDLLADFVRRIQQLEDDFARRSGSRPSSPDLEWPPGRTPATGAGPSAPHVADGTGVPVCVSG
jgi:hypothetical protein